jgi:hypothetical protein
MSITLAAAVRTSVVAAAVAVAAWFLYAPGNASAHEVREVGDYTFIVGFAIEPAFLYDPNSIDLIIEDAEENGVEGLEETLTATVSFGGDANTRDLPLEAAFGESGVYHSWFVPTEAGAYTFHVTGSVNGQEIDESFTSGPETFSEIEDLAPHQFPTEVMNNAQLEDALAAAGGGGGDDADTALVIAIIGVVVGALGLGAGGLALARRGS